MIELATKIAISIFLLALLMNFWSLLRGPSPLDRIMALDTMYNNSAASIILFGILLKDPIYFEAALLIAMMGFVSTVALAKFKLSGNIVD